MIMWDLKIVTFFIFLYLALTEFITNFLLINLSELFLTYINININFSKNYTIIFSFKFLICIFFLVLIRGGTPRYRYDYLTKLGWLKFLSSSIMFFVLTLFTYLIL